VTHEGSSLKTQERTYPKEKPMMGMTALQIMRGADSTVRMKTPDPAAHTTTIPNTTMSMRLRPT